eukprot:TRINITY_DN2069_c0_g1_i1.p1 TRINITY_DN2069_c0_g1~~TRINITY_DN2069_c0_g1_i1.p1  ORF type:complete len:202 (+),score=64.38 TRINITY_DN2069_c0_g1_i1:35-607(+)
MDFRLSLLSLFDECDPDKLGEVSIETVSNRILDIYPNYSDNKKFIKMINQAMSKLSSNEMTIKRNDFILFEKQLKQSVFDAPYRYVFSFFDKDDNGMLERPELARLFNDIMGLSLTREEIIDTFNLVDQDGNGAIDFNEFKFLCQKVCWIPDIVFSDLDVITGKLIFDDIELDDEEEQTEETFTGELFNN